MYSVIRNIFTFYCSCLIIFFASVSSSLVQNSSRPLTFDLLCNQRPARDLRHFNSIELSDFLRSFDTVVTDISAIMRQSSSPSVAVEILKNLQRCNKQNIFLMDDSIFPVQNYMFSLNAYFNFTVNESQFILPHESLLWYLGKFRMNKKVIAFVVGSDQFIKKLKDAGVYVLPALKNINKNNYHRHNTITVDRKVNTVIVDLDVSTNWGELAQAGLYLKNEKVQFLAGTTQKELYANKFHKVIGPGYFEEILTNYSGRIPLHYGKPGAIMRDYIMERYPAIASNPKRVLFIGNSLDVDMKYAYMCGFQKLWLDSDANESIVFELVKDCMTTPDYYLPDISKMRFYGCR